MKSRFLFLAILSVIVLFVASAFQAEPPDWTDLSAVLAWLAGPGAAIAVLALGDWLNTVWPWWAAATQEIKDLLTMIAASVVALAATFIPSPIVEQLAPFYHVVAVVILALVTAGLYLYARKRGFRAGERSQLEAAQKAIESYKASNTPR